MADNDNDPAGSTQMFRAFVDEGSSTREPAASSSKSTGLIAVIGVVAVAVVAAVLWLALK